MPTASAADNSSAAANSMGVLENTSVKAGVNYTAGTLGSGGNTSPGLMFDATGSSIFNDEYDYLTPFAPYDGFAVKVDGTNFHNNNAIYVADAFSASGSLVDGIDTLTWSGSATIASSTWSIQHVYTLEGDQDYVDVQTTITAGSNASTVSFGRFIDPDARAAAGDDGITDNVLGYSGVPATNVVLSEALVSRYTLGLYSTDSNVTAGVTSPWSSQADGYSGTPTDYGGNLYGQGDDAIGMSWSWSSVSIGDTLTASYAYIFGPSAFDLSTFAAAYGIQNMVNAADAFDGIRPAQGTNGATDKDKFFNGLYNGLYGLTAQETAVALLQASGEVHAFALSDARDAWSDGLGTVRSSSQGVGDYYWVDMSGYNLAVDEDTIASAYDSKTRKFWIGSDVYQDRSTTYGVALGMSESALSMANSGSADTTTYSLAAYMRGAQGAFEYDGLVSLNRSNIDTNRSVSLSTGSLSNTSSSDVRGLAMSAQLGYRYDVAPSLVSGLAWIKGDLDNTRTDTFTEDGSTVTALTVNGYEVKSAKVSVGYTLSGKIPNSGVEAGLWSFGVGAAKDVSRGMPDVSRTMSLHGASWSVSVPKAGDVTKFVSGGIAIPLGNDAVAELSLSAAKRDGALSKSAAFGFSAKW